MCNETLAPKEVWVSPVITAVPIRATATGVNPGGQPSGCNPSNNSPGSCPS